MKKKLTILFLFICAHNYAQDVYPLIINFDVTNKTTNDENVWLTTTYHFLMLNPNKAIDLKKIGNEKCTFKIVASNKNRIIVEFNQPSKLISKGRCASGEEKGFVFFNVDDKANLISSTTYLTESCIWSIEIIDNQYESINKIKYVSENLQNSKSFTTTIDLENLTIFKEEEH